MQDNSFERYPGSSSETKVEYSVPIEQDFAKNFEQDVPPFAGEQFGIAHQDNDYYGESMDDDSEYDEGVSDAATLINYGLDAVAREKGVEAVIQGIKSFDVTGSSNPLRDLYVHLGIDNPEELDDVREESLATKPAKEKFRDEYNMPRTQRRSREGAIKAIQDMKELIAEVESADPRYEELRSSAKSYGKGYFEYAVKDYGLRGLTDLFSVLANQREHKEQEESQGQDNVQNEQPESEEQPEQNKQPESEEQLELEEQTEPEEYHHLEDARESKPEKDPSITLGSDNEED